jgi:MSHA biogenesis protein MshQ
VSLSFNASGVASTTLQYADVGKVDLTATFSSTSGSNAGLTMTGSGSFIAAPKDFSVATSGSYVAGKAFAATVTARNSSGSATPNFGKESTPEKVLLSFAKYQPTGTGASAGGFSGTGVSSAVSSFASGVLSVSDLKWTEVGTGDLTATLNSGSYLSTGLTASGTTGSTGGVGPFVPDHFNLAVSQGCGSSFTYSGQPFTATITALNLAGGTTVNYDGSSATTPNFAKAVTLSATSNAGTGSLSSTSVAATSFSAGVASLTSTSFAFASKLTAPTSVGLRAVDASGVSSATGSEGALALRSGRIHVSNAFGSEKQALSVPVLVQYWTGQAWAINSSDSCTTSFPAASVVRVNYLDRKGAATTAWTTTPSAISLSAGHGSLTLSAPSPTSTGTVDFAFNLGSSTTDASCLSSHPASTGAGLSWLRSMNGSANGCSTSSYTRDPSARATFGIYAPETQKEVFIKDLF